MPAVREAPSVDPQAWRQQILGVLSRAPEPDLIAIVGEGDEWAISLGAARVLTALVHIGQARSVIEFGAGQSSAILARAMHAVGGGRLTSIEHQPEYSATAWRRVTQYPTVDAVIVPAPLRMRPSRHGLLYEYLHIRSTLAARGPFDLVFVDGPPGYLGREAPLFAVAPYLTPHAIIMLDDAARAGEQTTLRRWARGLPLRMLFESSQIGRGVAVLQIDRPATASFVWRTLLGTCHDRYVAWRARRQ